MPVLASRTTTCSGGRIVRIGLLVAFDRSDAVARGRDREIGKLVQRHRRGGRNGNGRESGGKQQAHD